MNLSIRDLDDYLQENGFVQKPMKIHSDWVYWERGDIHLEASFDKSNGAVISFGVWIDGIGRIELRSINAKVTRKKTRDMNIYHDLNLTNTRGCLYLRDFGKKVYIHSKRKQEEEND